VLKEVELGQDSAKYTAISYTWIGSLDRKLIQVDGYDFYVTSNCHSAISAFLGADISGDDPKIAAAIQADVSYVWIDAICIDQSTSSRALAERGQQVTLMTEIFSSATLTFVDIGDNDYRERAKWITPHLAEGIAKRARKKVTSSSEEKFLLDGIRLWLYDLAQRRWFSRVVSIHTLWR
jgi:hypothetical protein